MMIRIESNGHVMGTKITDAQTGDIIPSIRKISYEVCANGDGVANVEMYPNEVDIICESNVCKTTEYFRKTYIKLRSSGHRCRQKTTRRI